MRIAAYQFAVSGSIIENFKEIENAIYLAKRKNVFRELYKRKTDINLVLFFSDTLMM